MDINQILTLTVSLLTIEIKDTLESHYKGYRYLKISFILIVALRIVIKSTADVIKWLWSFNALINEHISCKFVFF